MCTLSHPVIILKGFSNFLKLTLFIRIQLPGLYIIITMQMTYFYMQIILNLL